MEGPGNNKDLSPLSSFRFFFATHASFAWSKAWVKRFLDFWHARWCLLKALCCVNDLPHKQIRPSSPSLLLGPDDCMLISVALLNSPLKVELSPSLPR